MRDCIRDKQPQCYSASDQLWHFTLPICINQQVEGAIELTSQQSLAEHQKVITAFVTIYQNFLNIIHDGETDELTGLLNRKTFDKRLLSLLDIQKREQHQRAQEKTNANRRHSDSEIHAWLAIVDIDHFKRINDSFGHIYGDEVLLLLSQILKDNFRHSDIPFRFGGEEFVIVLEPTSNTHVAQVLERFRREVEQAQFPRVGRVTVSIGFAKLGGSDYPPHIIEHADKALYYAKENGRNRVAQYEPLLEQGLLSPKDDHSAIELFSDS